MYDKLNKTLNFILDQKSCDIVTTLDHYQTTLSSTTNIDQNWNVW